MIIVKLVIGTSFLPYAILFMSSVFQFGLVISLLIVSDNSQARLLLVTSENYKSVMIGLLATALAFNYLFNIAYLVIFVKYIKDLINRPKQVDYISHTCVLVFAFLTDFRFGLLVFAKLCSKPSVDIDRASRLTPVHYLCIASSFFDILIFVACGIGIYNAQNLSAIFMLSIDLLILVILNILITICLVVSSKP